jgi:hypothetical protein
MQYNIYINLPQPSNMVVVHIFRTRKNFFVQWTEEVGFVSYDPDRSSDEEERWGVSSLDMPLWAYLEGKRAIAAYLSN